MYNFDLNTSQPLCNPQQNAHMGNRKVCVTTEGDVLTLSEFAILMRDDIVKIVNDTDKNHNFSSN